jgi:hypothetical protein
MSVRFDKGQSQNTPVISSVIHHRQNPLDYIHYYLFQVYMHAHTHIYIRLVHEVQRLI